MEDTELLRIAADWGNTTSARSGMVLRQIALPQELVPGMALVVQGVRRCGKSTLLAQLVDHYALPRERCLFLNFEDPRLAGRLSHEVLDQMVRAFEAEGDVGGTYFLDEIQVVAGWQGWLRSQLDRSSQRRFVVTGSNAHLLSGELASVLTGRHFTVELFPFDFHEFGQLMPNASIDDYLRAGGFPATIRSPDHDLILRSYFNDIVERDVRERVGARSSQPLRQLVQMLFESAGSELSVRRAAAAIGVAVDTASAYLDAVESAYLVGSCPWFAWSERRRSARNKKYYPVDHGLRAAVITRTGADLGKQLECATYVQLRRRCRDIFYWRGKGEVDFVLLRGERVTPVQVCLEGPKPRHLAALDEFYADFPRADEAVFIDPDTLATGLPQLVG